MSALSSLWIPALLGYLSLTAILRSSSIRGKNLFLLASSVPAGFGICSLILFFSLWVYPPQARALALTTSLAAVLVLGYFLLFQRFHNAPLPAASNFRIDLKARLTKLFHNLAGSRRNAFVFAFRAFIFLIFLATLWGLIQFYLLSVSSNITGGWDARYVWLLKAKFMFRSPVEWQALCSPKIFWSHPDYPLLWPGTLAWGWHGMGQESFLWPPWASLSFYISCALILVWYLTSYVSPATGWLGGTFFLVLVPPLFWSICLYADLPLAFFITASGLTLVAALRSEDKRFFMVSGLMAGWAAWTKNEGLLFLLWAGALAGGAVLSDRRKNLAVKISFMKAFLGGAFLPGLSVLIFKMFLGKTGDYLGSGRSVQDYLALLFSGWERHGKILQAFGVHMADFASWKGLWIFFFLSCVALLLKKKKSRYDGLMPGLVLLINLGYILACLTTLYSLKFQLQTALERLLIHTAPLALAFSFEMLAFRNSTPEKQDGQTA